LVSPHVGVGGVEQSDQPGRKLHDDEPTSPARAWLAKRRLLLTRRAAPERYGQTGA
jgi:hypothetical protein